MRVKLDITKSVEQNADIYFKQAKKMKQKIIGAEKTIELFEKKYDKYLKNKNDNSDNDVVEVKKGSKIFWFEKFNWFITSSGHLAVAGKSANTNEDIIKKHTLKQDIVFHTDMAGSPFLVLKVNEDIRIDIKKYDIETPLIKHLRKYNKLHNSYLESKGNIEDDFVEIESEIGIKKFSKIELEECASFTAAKSRAWKSGFLTLKTFYVNPEQVSKTANSGEFMGKGSFMIRGKTNYIDPVINMAVGIVIVNGEEKIICAPLSVIKKYSFDNYVEIVQSKNKTSDCAKKIKSLLNYNGHIDDIVSVLPNGGSDVKDYKKLINLLK